MKTYTLGKEWKYGTGAGSVLLRITPDGHRAQCCVGVAMTQEGVADAVILGMGTLYDAMSDKVPEAWKGVSYGALRNLYGINDIPAAHRYSTPADRVAALNTVANPHGIHFVLVEDVSATL